MSLGNGGAQCIAVFIYCAPGGTLYSILVQKSSSGILLMLNVNTRDSIKVLFLVFKYTIALYSIVTLIADFEEWLPMWAVVTGDQDINFPGMNETTVAHGNYEFNLILVNSSRQIN